MWNQLSKQLEVVTHLLFQLGDAVIFQGLLLIFPSFSQVFPFRNQMSGFHDETE